MEISFEEVALLDDENYDDDLLLCMFHREPSSESKCRLDINMLSDDQSTSLFRFVREDISRLQHTLELPNKIVCYQKTISYMPGPLLILLQRLAYPARLWDLELLFGRSHIEISIIFYHMINCF